MIFLIANSFYFSAQLEGKVENSNDILAARANYQEIMKNLIAIDKVTKMKGIQARIPFEVVIK